MSHAIPLSAGTLAAAPNAALLLIDFVNPFAFDCGDALFRRALPAARSAASLMLRAHALGVPCIFVNDSFDAGRTSLRDFIDHHRRHARRAEAIVAALPIDTERDHFVPKPLHSGFFRSNLDASLRRLRVDHLVLTGVAADICVLATAFDARMRGFELSVPCDCVAAESAEAERWALRLMARALRADVRPAALMATAAMEACGPAAPT